MKINIVYTSDTLPTKKNSKRIIYVKGKPIIVSSAEYVKWEKQFVSEIKTVEHKPWKVKSWEFIFFAPNKRKFDLDNKLTSILDWLVLGGFLEDDTYPCIPDIKVSFGGYAKTWEVHMVFITLEEWN